MKRDDDILRRLVRRLKSTRASVMLDFAFVAPFVTTVAIFSADFTNILRTEQQLEIAARLMADVEAHMADYHGKAKSPSSETKTIGKHYLRDYAQITPSIEDIYVKGSCDTVKNPISVAVAWIDKFFKGQVFSDEGGSVGKFFVNVLGKILGGIANFVSFRTIRYLTDVVPHDREVKVSCAAYIPTILPAAAYKTLSLPTRSADKIGVAQFTPDLEGKVAAKAGDFKINAASRHRVYCYMPVVDSAPVAPETYVRVFKSWCSKQPIIKDIFN